MSLLSLSMYRRTWSILLLSRARYAGMGELLNRLERHALYKSMVSDLTLFRINASNHAYSLRVGIHARSGPVISFPIPWQAAQLLAKIALPESRLFNKGFSSKGTGSAQSIFPV